MSTPAGPAAGQPDHGPPAIACTGPLPGGLTGRVDVLASNAGGLAPAGPGYAVRPVKCGCWLPDINSRHDPGHERLIGVLAAAPGSADVAPTRPRRRSQGRQAARAAPPGGGAAPPGPPPDLEPADRVTLAALSRLFPGPRGRLSSSPRRPCCDGTG